MCTDDYTITTYCTSVSVFFFFFKTVSFSSLRFPRPASPMMINQKWTSHVSHAAVRWFTGDCAGNDLHRGRPSPRRIRPTAAPKRRPRARIFQTLGRHQKTAAAPPVPVGRIGRVCYYTAVIVIFRINYYFFSRIHPFTVNVGRRTYVPTNLRPSGGDRLTIFRRRGEEEWSRIGQLRDTHFGFFFLKGEPVFPIRDGSSEN